MTQLALKPYEFPIIFIAIILIAIIIQGYLDQHQWLLWLIIIAIPTRIILGRKQPRNITNYPHQ